MKFKKLFKTTVVALSVTAMSLGLVGANAEAANQNFKDVPKTHWAGSAIYETVSKGMVTGYSDNTFRPSNNVTRAEFAAFLSRAFDGAFESNSTFSDVPSTHWAYPSVNEAIALGIIDTKDYGKKFEPDKVMTRAEIAKWLSKGLASSNIEYQNAIDEMANSDLTIIPIPEFYKGGVNKADLPYIGVALGTGLLSGYTDETFKPNDKTTRAEVSVILTRFLSNMKKSPKDFNDLNEFREVALTGTNILTVTNFKEMAEGQGFKEILGKPYTYSTLGTGAIEHVIFVDTIGLPKGAYSKMFTANSSKMKNGRYTTFIEYSFTTNQSISYDQWLNSKSTGYFTGLQLMSSAPTAKYGYRTPLVSKSEVVGKGKFFKIGTKNVFWGYAGAGTAVGERLIGYTDDGSSYGYIIK
ncbi:MULTISPECIES: S-layer homology domain-containing protein [unclassified Lysinibacillus]|uniref:S-layer homology domain-containing protein n=1 Tax=unclassified Lysinibacillus TaxID=2636778 RepID=UPI00131F3CCF|nr:MULTISPECIES: S-layer homology domain-containing protein [unclassified Lysinibacillus]